MTRQIIGAAIRPASAASHRLQQRDEQANDGRKLLVAFSELHHFGLKLDGTKVEYIKTDYGTALAESHPRKVEEGYREKHRDEYSWLSE